MKKEINGIISITAKWIAWFSIIGMGMLVCIITYWVLYPYHIITVKEPAKILTVGDKVKRGELLTFEFDYHKYYDIPARVTRMLENDRQVCLIQSGGMAHVGKHKIPVDVLIPLNVWPGKYRLKMLYEYEVNPIRTLKYTYYTEWFEVLP